MSPRAPTLISLLLHFKETEICTIVKALRCIFGEKLIRKQLVAIKTIQISISEKLLEKIEIETFNKMTYIAFESINLLVIT